MAERYFCDRCDKEMPYRARSAALAVHHENGKSYSIDLSVSIIGHHKDRAEICEKCVKELTKKAAGAAHEA